MEVFIKWCVVQVGSAGQAGCDVREAQMKYSKAFKGLLAFLRVMAFSKHYIM
jgi:hypothetical protein